MHAVLLSIVLLLLSGCGAAPHPSASVPAPAPAANSASPSIPVLQGHVNDYAGILTSEQRAALESRLAQYELETTHQIGVLTVPSLKGEPIESFSLRVANAWKLGRKGLDNGVLVTVAPQDRKARIELGTGMSRVVSDAAAAKIMNDVMIPEFRKLQYEKGIELGIERLMVECRAYKVPP